MRDIVVIDSLVEQGDDFYFADTVISIAYV
jgi:hypothetical protein